MESTDEQYESKALEAIVHNVQAKTRSNTPPECAFCGDKHFFDKCPIVTNDTFLRDFAIRSHVLHTKLHNSARKRILSPKKVNAITADEISAAVDKFTEPWDFRNGGT